jgi:hypothetical protein
MNAFVSSFASADAIKDLAVGDTVRYRNVNGTYRRYDSFNKNHSLIVIELGKGTTGKLLFKGMQNGIETPFLSAENFEIIKKVEALFAQDGSKAVIDTLIVDAGTLKLERAVAWDARHAAIDNILRKDMNKKLKVFKLEGEVSVGELPIVWKKS